MQYPPGYAPPPGYPAPGYPAPAPAPGYQPPGGYAPPPGYPAPPQYGVQGPGGYAPPGYQAPMPAHNAHEALVRKIAEAEVFGSAYYFETGHFVVRIERVYFHSTRKNETMFIVETTVLESNNPARPPGSQPSWSMNCTTNDSASANVKKFIGACAGIHSSEKDLLNAKVTPVVILAVTGPTNPLGGLVISVDVHLKDNQAKTGQYHVMSWANPQGKDPSWTGPAQTEPTPPRAPEPTHLSGIPVGTIREAMGQFAATHAPVQTSVWPGAGMQGPPPPAPMPLPPAPPAAPFPPAGWYPHPGAPGCFHNGVEVRTEAELRAMF